MKQRDDRDHGEPEGERGPPSLKPQGPDRRDDQHERDPEEQKAAMLGALWRATSRLMASHPLLIVFEDVQWADDVTLENIQVEISADGVDYSADVPLKLTFTKDD